LEQENRIVEKEKLIEIPLLRKFASFVFGKVEPDPISKVAFYINLFIWFIFSIWHLISYIAISYRDVILEEKKINIEILILNRGANLGFDPSVFLNRLLNFHFLSILCWLIILIGIILMWRQKKSSIFFIFIPFVFYFSLVFLYIGLRYFNEDTSLFDKITLTIFTINSLIFFYTLSKKKNNQHANFFESD
jgi:hypothetical protein